MWSLWIAMAAASEPSVAPPTADPVDTTAQFNVGKGVALGGFGLGVAGNLLGLYTTVSLIDDIDPTTNAVDPDAVADLRPLSLTAGLLNTTGGAVMGLGTLQMHAANRRAGADYTPLFGQMSLGFGAGAVALSLGSFAVSEGAAPDSANAAAGNLIGLGASGLALASFTTGFIQYVVNHANKPPKRRRITDARLRPQLIPTGNGAAVVGRF